MKYLSEYGFSDEVISYIENNVPKIILDALETNKKLVVCNIEYLRELGIENYTEIFKKYYDMFLMDTYNFGEVFNKYDKEDLVDKINKNIAIVEHL